MKQAFGWTRRMVNKRAEAVPAHIPADDLHEGRVQANLGLLALNFGLFIGVAFVPENWRDMAEQALLTGVFLATLAVHGRRIRWRMAGVAGADRGAVGREAGGGAGAGAGGGSAQRRVFSVRDFAAGDAGGGGEKSDAAGAAGGGERLSPDRAGVFAAGGGDGRGLAGILHGRGLGGGAGSGGGFS
jgi:hypothetical protein